MRNPARAIMRGGAGDNACGRLMNCDGVLCGDALMWQRHPAIIRNNVKRNIPAARNRCGGGNDLAEGSGTADCRLAIIMAAAAIIYRHNGAPAAAAAGH